VQDAVGAIVTYLDQHKTIADQFLRVDVRNNSRRAIRRVLRLG
jgi:hypothetical protein